MSVAFWRKYPNPLSKHVHSSDVLTRTVDAETKVMSTTRLIVKQGALPRYGERFVGKSVGMVVEKSTVDPVNRTMTTVTKNLTYAGVMCLEETCTYRQSSENPEWTDFSTTATVTSGVYGWRSTIESWGVEKFKSTQARGKEALQNVITRIREEKADLLAGARAARQATAERIATAAAAAKQKHLVHAAAEDESECVLE